MSEKKLSPGKKSREIPAIKTGKQDGKAFHPKENFYIGSKAQLLCF